MNANLDIYRLATSIAGEDAEVLGLPHYDWLSGNAGAFSRTREEFVKDVLKFAADFNLCVVKQLIENKLELENCEEDRKKECFAIHAKLLNMLTWSYQSVVLKRLASRDWQGPDVWLTKIHLMKFYRKPMPDKDRVRCGGKLNNQN